MNGTKGPVDLPNPASTLIEKQPWYPHDDMPSAVSAATLADFRRFIEAARSILAEAHDESSLPTGHTHPAPPQDEEDLLHKFQAFVATARPLATEAARKYLEWFEPHAARLLPVLGGDDLLQLAGYTGVENAYTRLLGWVLGDDNPSPLAAAVQRVWVSRLVPEATFSKPLKVHVELETSVGRPDVVMVSDELLVVVEAKTGTREHEAAQTGEQQTVAYERVPNDVPVSSKAPPVIVFLTVRGERAANGAAINTTYAELGVIVLEAIATVEASTEAKVPYRALAAHWLSHATPGFEMAEVARLGINRGSLDERQILDALPDLAAVERLIPRRGQ